MVLGSFWVHFRVVWDALEASWPLLGASWALFGRLLGSLGRVLDVSWASCAPLRLFGIDFASNLARFGLNWKGFEGFKAWTGHLVTQAWEGH